MNSWRRRLAGAQQLQDFDATVEVGVTARHTSRCTGPAGVPWDAWARGVAEMAGAIADGRPHRASAEQAAHVVDILEAAARSIADGGRRIELGSTFAPPPLMPWAVTADG